MDTQTAVRENKVQELRMTLEELSNKVVTDTAMLDAFVKKWGGGFHNYSFFNLLLIWSQKPDATLCAGYHTWLTHHRFVKKGEHGIAILAPIIYRKKEDEDDGTEHTVRRFKVVYIFDYSQTEGEPIDLGCADSVTGQVTHSVAELANIFGRKLEIESEARASNGHVSRGDRATIWLTSRNEEPAMVATFCHELAHQELGHADQDCAISRNIMELEAEATSYIVCRYMGIENDRSRFYIGKWSSTEELGKAGSRILKTAEKIIRTIEGANDDRATEEN